MTGMVPAGLSSKGLGPNLHFPTHPDAVSPAWLTRVLRTAGKLRNGRVTAVRRELPAVQGIAGQVLRLHLGYDRVEENQLASVIAKFPSSDPDVARGMQHLYQAETRFYQNLPADFGIAVPKPYLAAQDGTGRHNLILLEDLSEAARAGNIVSGCTLDEASAVVTQLAKFHAAWWDRKLGECFLWLGHKADFLSDEMGASFASSIEPWMARVEVEVPGFHFPSAFHQAAGLLARNFLRVKHFLYNAPATIAHDDAKLDNMLFRGSRQNPELVLVDWHLVTRAPGVCDLGYFMAFSLSPEQRRRAEAGLLWRYYSKLCDHGVRGYDFSRFQLEYRMSALEPLERAIQASFALNRSNPAIVAYWRAILVRLCAFVVDCRFGDLLR
jgi:hypothetical protein